MPKWNTQIDIQYLIARMTCIDIILRRAVHRWQRADQNPLDEFRGLYVSDKDAIKLLERPFGSSWGQNVSLSEKEEAAFAAKLSEAAQHVESTAKNAQTEKTILRLDYLQSAFGLDSFEMNVLMLCLIPFLDLRYERIYAYLQDDVSRRRPSVGLVLNLLCEPGVPRLSYYKYFDESTFLFSRHLLELIPASTSDDSTFLRQTLTIDPSVVSWLIGRYSPHEALGTDVVLSQPLENDTDSLLAANLKLELDSAAAVHPVVEFWGPDQVAKSAAANCLAVQMQQPLLTVHMDRLSKTEQSPMRILRLALRDATMTDAVLYLSGWDAYLDQAASSFELWKELDAHSGLIILAGSKPWQPTGYARRRRLFQQQFPEPEIVQRKILWTHYLGNSTDKSQLDIDKLADQFVLTTGQIRDAAASAQDLAQGANRALQDQDLFIAARLTSNPNLAGLAHKIEPRYELEDIILPEDQKTQLEEIICAVKKRSLVLDRWGLGRKLVASRGVAILFSGPSGTGKTMAAEIVARGLEQVLYKIDLSTLVSKYVGETEKNLEKIFSEAESSNAVLFFDEADAIFGKRSEVRDAHDRYANIEVSYLLQRMESYDGVTILSTNLRANLDEAFTRRLQFAIDFPFPDEKSRRKIWIKLLALSEDAPKDPKDLSKNFALFAGGFKLAGGSIRNVIVRAAYLAAKENGDGPILEKHLRNGIKRELQKMGLPTYELKEKINAT